MLLETVCFGYLLEAPHWGDSIKYPKHILCGNKNSTRPFLHIIQLIKDSLQQRIHYDFNGIFGNKSRIERKTVVTQTYFETLL